MKIFQTVFGLMAFVCILGIAGSYEWASEVVYDMPEEVYYTILDTLGDDASEKAIANEYMNNKEYYDSIKDYE